MFELGGKVIAIIDHSERVFKRGDIFTVEGIKTGCCKEAKILIKISLTFDSDKRTVCSNCSYMQGIGEAWFDSMCFLIYDDSDSSFRFKI